MFKFSSKLKNAVAVLLVLFALFSIVSFASDSRLLVNIEVSLKDPLVIEAQNVEFGQVIPNQNKTTTLLISLASEFLNIQRVKKASYFIQKLIRPKNPQDSDYCNNVNNFPSGQIENNLNSQYFQRCYLPLCPFIEITKKQSENISEKGTIINARPINQQVSLKTFSDVFIENGISNPDPQLFILDTAKDIGVAAFNYPYTKRGHFEFPLVLGILDKQLQDIQDEWDLTLKTPCFQGNCSQTPSLESFDKIPQVLKDKQWGCDIIVSILSIN